MNKGILKKAAGLTMAVVLTVTMALSAAARTAETGPEIRTEIIDGREYQVLTGTEAQVKANMQYFSSVYATVEPQSGKLHLGGAFITKSNIPVNFSMAAERSTNNSSWTSVSGQSWTQSYNALAYAVQPMYRTYANPLSNYYYRTNAYAEYRVNGILIEGVRAYSPGARYPAAKAAAIVEEPTYEVYQLVE